MKAAKSWRVAVLLATSLLILGVGSASAAAAGLAFHTGTGKKFTLAGGSAAFGTVEGSSEPCAAVTGEGEVTGSQTASLKLRLTGCRTGSGLACRSAGATSGEILTGSLPVQLVYISRVRDELGLLINPRSAPIASWECGALLQHQGIQGSIVVPVSPVDTKVTSHTLTLQANAGGVQASSSYEDAEERLETDVVPTVAIGSSGLHQAGSLAVAGMTLKTSEALEISG